MILGRETRVAKLKATRALLVSRNERIQADLTMFVESWNPEIARILNDFKLQNTKKIARLTRRIDRIENKYANKGQHVLNPKYKGEN